MRLLVTGASGFVAPYVISELEQHGIGHADTLLTSLHGDGNRVVGLDMRDRSAVRALIKDFLPTKILHLAAQSSLVKSDADSSEAWNANFEATRYLAEAVTALAPGALFVFASTAQVYGRSFLQRAAVRETTPIDPQGTYAHSKAAAELMLRDILAPFAKVVILRLFNHTGPGQSRDFVVPNFAAQIADAERGAIAPVVRVGNLAARRDFLDVRDVARAYKMILAADHAPEGHATYNLGSGRTRSIQSILDSLLAKATIPIRTEGDADRMRSVDIPRTCGSIAEFSRDYGWVPEIGFQRTLLDTLEYWRAASRAGQSSPPSNAASPEK